ncbi:MAG: hypothetical protein AB7J28_02370 [Hyphomonadaceae bacterium]
MSIDERIPTLNDAELTTLKANAERLLETGSPKQKNEAERLLPLIQSEQAERKAKAPPKAVKAPAKRAPAKSKKKTAAAAAG